MVRHELVGARMPSKLSSWKGLKAKVSDPGWPIRVAGDEACAILALAAFRRDTVSIHEIYMTSY